VSLISMASLGRLREEMGVDRPVDPRRFRMLFQIDGVGPNEEDTWIGRHVKVGDAELIITGDIGRCVVTSRDPDTGITDMPTLAALAGYRREGRSEPLPLGVKGTVLHARPRPCRGPRKPAVARDALAEASRNGSSMPTITS
jgi:hypothetical protein